MRLDVRAIDSRRMGQYTRRDQRFQNVVPDLLVGPAVEAVVDRRVRAVFRRAVTPAAAGLQNMQDAADYPSVIDPPGARLVPRQMRLYRRPGIVAQPEKM